MSNYDCIGCQNNLGYENNMNSKRDSYYGKDFTFREGYGDSKLYYMTLERAGRTSLN